MIPSDRQSFKDYCLRKLGSPVIQINVSNDQVDDRVDEALNLYFTFHTDGTSHTFYKYQVTANDISNKYITLPQNVIGVVRIFDIGLYMGVDNLFNIKYQLALSDLYTFSSQPLVPYFMAMEHIATMQELLVGKKPIDFDRRTNKLYIRSDWNNGDITPGMYLIIECYQTIDPDIYTQVWSDFWLQRYASALIKKQWADNLSKFKGQSLPGNIQFNATDIMTDALREIEKLEYELRNTWETPAQIFTG